MTLDASTPIEQVAATVSGALAAAGITAVLSGGAAVQIYTSGLYVSRDLDFVSAAGHREIAAGLDQVLTPTQCVMDRLAAFYHWRDRQALDQAVAVTASQEVDLDAARRWSVAEAHGEHYEEFLRAVRRGS